MRGRTLKQLGLGLGSTAWCPSSIPLFLIPSRSPVSCPGASAVVPSGWSEAAVPSQLRAPPTPPQRVPFITLPGSHSAPLTPSPPLLAMSEDRLVVTNWWGKGNRLASRGWLPKMLLNILQTQDSPHHKELSSPKCH